MNNSQAKKAYCPKCGAPLSPSDIEGYDYVCYDCDENFYGFEAVDESGEHNFIQEAISEKRARNCDFFDIISEEIEEENGVYSGFLSEEEAEAFAKEKGIAEYTIERMGDDDTYTLYDDDASNEEEEK